IARDLRREVLALMRDGKDDAAIKQFLVARYGDFVLYRPRMGAGTWALWFGPALLLLGGGLLVVRVVRARSRTHLPTREEDQEW
ncbi:MAG TPA: cytochrome c-type biogenesis protein, partial [Luteimonas sp.]|nr:cytochrome c-type biogenesis protein [Luteimonas sp.]